MLFLNLSNVFCVLCSCYIYMTHILYIYIYMYKMLLLYMYITCMYVCMYVYVVPQLFSFNFNQLAARNRGGSSEIPDANTDDTAASNKHPSPLF
jgi:hypothetical protein